MSTAPRITWIGLRGFPNVQGGVESCAEQLCPLLHELGCDVTVITRRGYQPPAVGSAWHGVHFVALWAPRQKQLEAVVHTFLAVLYAGLVSRPDVLHIQAIGPALWTLLARLLGLRVVVTHHGPDYDRQKWGRVARLVLRLGEVCAACWCNELIVISRVIQRSVAAQHGRVGVLVANGITLPTRQPDPALLPAFGLVPGRYVLLVSRLVPEKHHLDLIAAFAQAQLGADWKLAIVGAADHADAYARSVSEAAARAPGVVMTGFQTGAACSCCRPRTRACPSRSSKPSRTACPCWPATSRPTWKWACPMHAISRWAMWLRWPPSCGSTASSLKAKPSAGSGNSGRRPSSTGPATPAPRRPSTPRCAACRPCPAGQRPASSEWWRNADLS